LKSLRQQTISGLSWSFVDKFFSQAIQFITGIILARLLTPHEYGLTGMVAIFLAISNVFITSGFSEALVRATEISSKDYSTVFIFNFVISGLCFLLLVLFSKNISVFFNEPSLSTITIFLSTTLIINSLGFVQRTFLWKKMHFKALTISSISATFISGIIAIFLAINNYGVWSLVWKTIVSSIVGLIVVNIFSTIKIKFEFNKDSFKELFGFGSKLLLSQLLNQIFINIYSLVIAKFFSAKELGLYSRADQYKNLPSRTINDVIQSVSFPLLAKIKDDKVKLKSAYKRLIRSTMLITFVLMFGMAATADNLIIGLIGEKWRETIPYLQLLCFVGIFYPISALNLNILNVLGRSDIFLKLELIKKIIIIPTIFFGIYLGIVAMILGIILTSIIAYYLNSHFSGKFIDYPFSEQVIDILPAFSIGILTGISVFLTGYFLKLQPLILLFLQIIQGFTIFYFISELFKQKDYLYIKNIVIEKFIKR